MRVLVACEFSGIVRDTFAEQGHHASSCDLLPSDKPGNHFRNSVKFLLYRQLKWDLMIAHPPCTYLSASGLHWNSRIPGRSAKTAKALHFVQLLLSSPIPKIALENPVGRISSAIRPPDQYIHPWMHGHDASKKTGLWLKNLPLLQPSEVIKPRLVCQKCKELALPAFVCPNCKSTKLAKRWANQTPSGQNKLGPSPDRWKLRSTTYPGIAKAMANQWGNLP